MSAAPIKVIINTHPSYHHVLDVLLTSLDFKNHLNDIILCVSDVPADKVCETKLLYAETYGFDSTHVVTTHLNIDEYSAFVALSDAIKNPTSGLELPDDALFLMIHDTCEAGRLFWDLLRTRFYNTICACCDRDNLPDFVEDNRMIFKIPLEYDPIKYVLSVNGPGKSSVIMFRQFQLDEEDGKMRTTCRYVDGEQQKEVSGFLSYDLTVTRDESHALVIESKGSRLSPCECINESIRKKCKKYMWWPVSENFNLGIATKEFVLRAGLAFSSVDQYSKQSGISIEIDNENPLNLKLLATVVGIPRWRYVFHNDWDVRSCRFPTMSLWLNDTDVYGNGKRRNISYLHTLDLKKYSCLVGELWDASHESGR